MNTIQISDNNREAILGMMNKEIDDEGYIISKDTKKRVKCYYSKEEINIKDSYSILPGSTVFIKNNDLSFAKYLVKK